MRMSHDHFATLGLSPGRYKPAEIRRRFERERARLLRALDDPARGDAVRQELDALYVAYRALRESQLQEAHLRPAAPKDDRLEHMRRLIEASLEGGLLRYSRRQEIVREGRELGFSEFHTQLLIAQVQFGDRELLPVSGSRRRAARSDPDRAGVRLAAAGVLALAFLLAIVRWLNV